MASIQELDYLKIPLEHIKLATNNFSDDNFIGQGGFGRVYKGQLPILDSATTSTARSAKTVATVAVKRLDVKGRQGQHEFLMELALLAGYKHDNLVSLLGFSEEGNEKILVYEYEVNGSLDNHLASTNLTWEQRLRICLGAARGLEYLHDGVGKGHRVLHRDIKSSNILLDENWKAKISDFGLSKIGPTNQQFTFLVTMACGTLGYLDPVYVHTGVLTKKSDVYSFGVVLFEVLCGRLALLGKYEDERRFLSTLVKLHYRKGKLDQIIMPHLLEQMKPFSLKVFSKIAFRCLNEDRKDRPVMRSIVNDLEIALEYQLGTRTTDLEPQTDTRTKLWGSKTGGNPFSFQLESNQKLKKITIYHDRWIHSLIFTAQDSNGALHSSQQYGGLHDPNNKGEMFEIEFDDNEELVGLSGSDGIHNSLHLISSLSFVTNKKTHGPFGKKAYNRFSGSWEEGLFDGFYGRYGWYIDAIGCLLKAT